MTNDFRELFRRANAGKPGAVLRLGPTKTKQSDYDLLEVASSTRGKGVSAREIGRECNKITC
jgi:hypothetical protein